MICNFSTCSVSYIRRFLNSGTYVENLKFHYKEPRTNMQVPIQIQMNNPLISLTRLGKSIVLKSRTRYKQFHSLNKDDRTWWYKTAHNSILNRHKCQKILLQVANSTAHPPNQILSVDLLSFENRLDLL